MSDLDEIAKRKADALAQLRAIEQEEKAALASAKPAAIERIKADITKFGITASELGFSPGESDTARPASGKKAMKRDTSPKYRNPETDEEWSGLGKHPAWIPADKEARKKFLIAQ